MKVTPSQVERRRASRHKVCKQARIGAEAGGAICVVRDMSATGARLTLLKETTVPDRFDVLIITEGLTLPVRVIWRGGLDLGVARDGEPWLSP